MSARVDRMRDLVGYLCSEVCAGRLPGSPEGEAARARIVEELESIGVSPYGENGTWLQAIPGVGANVLGTLEGNGPLADRSVLVAAHYDHFGRVDGETYWGADDNAAAVAILCEVARELARMPERLGRRVIFAPFDAEEPPHFLGPTMGSMHYVANPPHRIDTIDMMVCMDLVGHAVGPPALPDAVRETLFVLGAELSEGTGALVDDVVSRAQGVAPHRLHLDIIPPLSDYYAFRRAGIPLLFLSCGRWEHYHMPTDTPDRLDYPKMDGTVDFVTDLMVAFSTRTDGGAFLPNGIDDVATLESLKSVGADLIDLVPEIRPHLDVVDVLLDKAHAAGLDPADHEVVSQLAIGVEELLGAH